MSEQAKAEAAAEADNVFDSQDNNQFRDRNDFYDKVNIAASLKCLHKI